MLRGKVALVTGASRGIGREIALALAEYGASVVVNYNGSKECAEQVVEQIRAMDTMAAGAADAAIAARAVACRANVADADEAMALFSECIKEFGRIDILVNNAGITRDNLILKMSEEEFNDVIDTNLKGVFHCMKHASKCMLKQRSGRIINISSISGIIGNAGQANYCAAKAGILGMTKSLARELGSRGITVNAVAPGFITTEMTDKLSDQAKEAMMAQIPLKHAGTARDVAEMVAFLASDKAAYITGQTIQVDGGMGM